MTIEQRIRRDILIQDGYTEKLTAENVDDIYEERLINEDAHWDYESEFRSSGEQTNLPCPSSRHYESKSVACKLSDGGWIGWTYWYGGGKHGEPGAIDWMEDAYEVDMTEEEKMVTIRTFTKKE